MPPASSNKSVHGLGPDGRTWKYVALAAFLVTATSLLAQVSAESAVLTSTTATGLSPTTETSSSTHPVVTAQQRVLRYSSGHTATEPEAPGQGASEEKSPHTLHLLVGRSLFVSSPQRLRKVYVSNPAVLDSFTASPYQLVITGKAAGTSSLVVWDETGQSVLYTVLADLDVSGLQDSLAKALPGDQVEVKAVEGRVYLSGVVGSDEIVNEAVTLAKSYSKEVVNSLVVDPRHIPQVELRVRIAELDRTKLTQFGFNFFSTGKNAAAITTQGFSPPSFPQIGGGSSTQALIQDVLNLFTSTPI